MPRKKIILVSYGGGHINMLVPVIKKLQRNRNLHLVVLGLTTAGAVLKRECIPYIGFKDLLDAGNHRALEWGKRLAGPASPSAVVSYEESVAYMGLSYTDLELRHGVEEAAHIYSTKGGRQSFYPLSIMEEYLQKECPDLVVATNSPRAEQAAITAAGNLSIPAICLVDLFALQAVRWIGKQGYANKVCVLSDVVKQYFIQAGRSSDDIVVTGNPSFDHLLEYKRKPETLRKKMGWEDAKVILWASQPEPVQHPFADKTGNPDLPRKVDKTLMKIVSRHSGWNLVIRPHPSESINYSNLPENVQIGAGSESLHELILAVDVVVTLSSTVGLEAVLLGKPLITLDISIFTEDAPYSKMGISKGVGDLNNLEQALMTVLSGDWQCSADLPKIGGATDRVISVINEYI